VVEKATESLHHSSLPSYSLIYRVRERCAIHPSRQPSNACVISSPETNQMG
jgi:hypothetical protein